MNVIKINYIIAEIDHMRKNSKSCTNRDKNWSYASHSKLSKNEQKIKQARVGEMILGKFVCDHINKYN